eukprot:gnl/MRDRNA2_/MRDRNA2_192009_c0_seq1.p1 gnl/MRDRNA2_/MRDRNA2_192009_c0~~gnl/MRDRNA2_/MRDRNA2_192009_c0_seq1.p1  ORF type:complete len:219 (+),score=25.26 gnl/MRDRNA2_/MRDRNA2_192009_c0_seq1:47-658(+)
MSKEGITQVGNISEADHRVLLLNVFMEGFFDVIFEKDERDKMIHSMTHVLEIVPIPSVILEYLAEKGITLIKRDFESAFQTTFDAYKAAAVSREPLNCIPEAVTHIPVSEDEAKKLAKSPFSSRLRCQLCESLIEQCKREVFFLKVCHYFAEVSTVKCFLYMVDCVFKGIHQDFGKLEKVMAIVVHPHHPPEVATLRMILSET